MLLLLLVLQTPKIDPSAMSLLKKNRDAMLSLRSYSADCKVTNKTLQPEAGEPPVTYQYSTLKAVKPNLMRYDMWEAPKPVTRPPQLPTAFTVVSSGSKTWIQSRRTYRVEPNSDPNKLQTIMEPWDGFYSSEGTAYQTIQAKRKAGADVEVKRLGKEKVGGTIYDKVGIDLKEKFNGKVFSTRKVLFLRPDGLVSRQSMVFRVGASGYTSLSILDHIQKNGVTPRRAFTYTPPKGVTLALSPDQALLKPGAAAPDFSAKDQFGKEVKLSQLRGSVVVIDFWASWCTPCINSMAHTQAVAQKFLDSNSPVVLLAVDDSEKFDDFTKWVSASASKFPALRFVYSPQEKGVSTRLYRVAGIPTQFVIDPRGIITKTFVGYNGPSDDLERAIKAALPKER